MTIDPDHPEVTLGDHTYKVVPQRVARVARAVPRALVGIGETTSASVLELFVVGGWRLLREFIPDLMPEHEFRGYSEPAFAELQAAEQRIAAIRGELGKE